MDFDSLVDDSQKQQAAPAPTPVPKEEKPLMFDELKSDTEAAPKFDDLVDDSQKHQTSGQQVLAGIEGLGRGAIPGIDALAVGMRKGAAAVGVPEEYLNYVAPPVEELAARQKENPVTSTATELVGNAMLMNKLPKIGSNAINGMIQMGLIAGNDEISKAILGQGDPLPAVASHIAESGAAGLLLGGLAGKAENIATKSLKALEETKVGSKLSSFLAGIGRAASLPEEGVVSLKNSSFVQNADKKFSAEAFRKGQEFYKTYFEKAPKYAARVVAPIIGNQIGGFGGAAAASVLEQALEKIAPSVSSKYIGPAVLKAAASGTVEDLSQVLNHAKTLEKGAHKIIKGVDSVFKSGAGELAEATVSDKEREKLKEFINNGGIEQELRDDAKEDVHNYASGGIISTKKPTALEQHWPEQNILLSSAKGRVSNYLNSLRPLPNQTKLPFDNSHHDKQKDKDYHSALDVAINPLSVLSHIKKGTLLPKHVNHMNQMYPELYQHLSNKLTERMMQGQVKNEKRPSYKTRQALSLFLGTSLDSTNTPAGIQAAQSVFAQQKAMKQPSQSNMSGIKTSGPDLMTAEQSRTKNLNKH